MCEGWILGETWERRGHRALGERGYDGGAAWMRCGNEDARIGGGAGMRRRLFTGGVAGDEVEFFGDVVGKWMRGGLDAGGKRAVRESLEIEEAGVAPFAGFAFLAGEEGGDVGVAFGVDERGERGPVLLEGADGVYAALVVEAEVIPEGVSRFEAVIPRDVVKPEEEVFGAVGEGAEFLGDGCGVLRN